MIKFALTTKDGEVINTISAQDLTEAANNFAILKKIKTEALLEIYNVKVFIR
jgi:hypothetical protein